MCYKLYVGKFSPKEEGICSAPSFYGNAPKELLHKYIDMALNNIKHGIDLYIETPKGKVKAWYRDLVNLTDEQREQFYES